MIRHVREYCRLQTTRSKTIKPILLQHFRDFFVDGKTSPPATSRPHGVHPSAVLEGEIELDEGATIGPNCVVSGRVKIGPRSRLLANCVVEGVTFIGADCTLGPNAAIGTPPQHRGYDGQETYLIIDDGVTAREFSSIHRSTKPGPENATRVGRRSLVMAGAHVAHDCRIGENVTVANAVQFGGHVTVGDDAFVGGGVVVHQFCRIGRLAIVAGGEILNKDVLPFGAVRYGGHRAYNAVGCRRAGLSGAALRELRSAFHFLLGRRSFPQAARLLREDRGDRLSSEVAELIDFIGSSRRGIQVMRSFRSSEAAGDDSD